jgi:hypothetical protein
MPRSNDELAFRQSGFRGSIRSQYADYLQRTNFRQMSVRRVIAPMRNRTAASTTRFLAFPMEEYPIHAEGGRLATVWTCQ